MRVERRTSGHTRLLWPTTSTEQQRGHYIEWSFLAMAVVIFKPEVVEGHENETRPTHPWIEAGTVVVRTLEDSAGLGLLRPC